MSKSWGYTDNQTYDLEGAKINFFDQKNYALVQDDKDGKVYVNLTCPTNQQERITVRAGKLNSVSTSFKKAYPSEAKSGYTFSVKNEEICRETKSDGTIYDDYAKVIITCSASDGTNATGGIVAGKDWLPHIMRAVSRLVEGVYDVSDGDFTLNTDQKQIDRLMHGSDELASGNVSQA